MKTHYNMAKAGSAETTALCNTLSPTGLFTRDKKRVNCILCLRRLEAQQKRRPQ